MTVVSPRGRGGGVFYLNVVNIIIIIQWWEGNKGKGQLRWGLQIEEKSIEQY